MSRLIADPQWVRKLDAALIDLVHAYAEARGREGYQALAIAREKAVAVASELGEESWSLIYRAVFDALQSPQLAAMRQLTMADRNEIKSAIDQNIEALIAGMEMPFRRQP